MTIAYIVATVFLSSFRIAAANYDKLGSLRFPFATRKFCFIADAAILVGSIYYLNWWVGLIVFALHLFSVISATLGWPFSHFFFKLFKDEFVAVRNSEGVLIYSAILYAIFVIVSFFVVDYACLFHSWTMTHTKVIAPLAGVGFIVREILVLKQNQFDVTKEKSSVKVPKSSIKETTIEKPEISIDEIKKETAELYLANYTAFQECVLQQFNYEDLFSIEDSEDALFISKLCLEYAVYLFEITYLQCSAFLGGYNEELTNYLCYEYFANTGFVYDTFSLFSEDYYSDKHIFDAISGYYDDVLSKKLKPMYLVPPLASAKQSRFSPIALYDLFINHFIYSLITNSFIIDTYTSIPLLDPIECIVILEKIKDINSELLLAQKYYSALSDYFEKHKYSQE